MSYNFNTTYALDPWANITTDQRQWFDPVLRERYVRKSVYSQHVPMKIDTNAMKSRTITFNDILPGRPNIGAIGDRTLNASRIYTDAYQKNLTVLRYGNGMSLHRESELFSYWQRGGDNALREIVDASIGQMVVDQLDALARKQPCAL